MRAERTGRNRQEAVDRGDQQPDIHEAHPQPP
jgi:hypothetical protein